MSERVIRRVGTAVALGGLLAAAAGCGGGGEAPQRPARQAHARVCAAGTERAVGSSRVAWAAVAVRPTAAFREPGARRIARFGLVNVNGAQTVFGVLGERVDRHCRATWLHVALPLRPVFCE